MRKLPKILSLEESQALLSRFNTRYWTPHRNRTLVLMMLDAGLRVSEATSIQLEHVNLVSRRLTVREGKGAKDRRVPIPGRLADALQGWLDRRTEELQEAAAETPYIFPTRTGNPVLPQDVWRFVKREARRAQIPEADRVSPHTLRHTYATDVLNHTASIAHVQRLLGHEDISTTQVYLHLADADIEEALNGFREESPR